MSSRLREMASSALGKYGFPFADVHICADADGGASFDYWENWAHADKDVFHTTIATAHSATVTGRNDVILLTPDNHTQTAALTWSNNLTHMVGMFPPAMLNQRSRIGHSATAAPLLTVSGYGNMFSNLYFMYGLNNATDLNCLTVTGERNSFLNCHFLAGHATPTDAAGFDLIRIHCNEGYYSNCTFGNDTVSWADGVLMELYGAADRSCRVVFDNCLFIMNQDAGADGTFLKTDAGMGTGVVIFRGCQFINVGTTMTAAINSTGLGNAKLFFDINCVFAGVTDICDADTEDENVFCALDYGKAGGNDNTNLIAGFPDKS